MMMFRGSLERFWRRLTSIWNRSVFINFLCFLGILVRDYYWWHVECIKSWVFQDFGN
jgi:hypothetical protein